MLLAIDKVVKNTKKYLYDREDKAYLQLTSYNRKYFKDCLKNSYKEIETGNYRSNHFLEACVFKNLTSKINEDLKLINDSNGKFEYLKKVLNTVIDKMYFAVIYANKHFSAATLFETLNFRGAILGVSDLFKSLVFSKAIEQRCQKQVDEIWKENIELIDQNSISMTDLLKHVWIAYNGKLVDGSLYKTFKRDLDADHNAKILDYLKMLKKNLKVYVDILKPFNKTRWKHDKNIEKSLMAINRLKSKECYPLLLALFLLPEEQQNKTEFYRARRKLLTAIENISFRRIICSKKENTELEKAYAECAKRLKEKTTDTVEDIEDLIKLLRRLSPDDRSFEQDFASFASPSLRLSRYILNRLEKYSIGRREPITEDTSEITIEHIMPKTLGRGWLKVSRYHKDYLNRIGNLTLLAKGLNVSNSTFIRKRTKYYQNSNANLTRALVGYSKWRKKEIIARQRELARIAVATWAV
jgi:hypothetical protein